MAGADSRNPRTGIEITDDGALRDAAVLITEGSTTTVRALALSFALASARVAVVSREPSDLHSMIADLLQAGAHDAVGLIADMTRMTGVTSVLDALRSRWGQLNVLVVAESESPLVERSSYDTDRVLDAPRDRALDTLSVIEAALPVLRRAAWAHIAVESSYDSIDLAAWHDRIHAFVADPPAEDIAVSIGPAPHLRTLLRAPTVQP